MDYSTERVKVDINVTEAQMILKYHLISRALIVQAKIKAWNIYDTDLKINQELNQLRVEFLEIQRQLVLINNDNVLSLK